jgi:hypothetical protein
MYRLPCTLSFALFLGANSIGFAEEPNLEFLEEMPATPRTSKEDSTTEFSLLESSPPPAQVAAENPKPAFSLLNEEQSADKVVAPTSDLTFTFLEDMQPTGPALDSKLQPESNANDKPIDFEMVFVAQVDEKPSTSALASSPKSAVVPVPTPPIAVNTVQGIPDPVARVAVPVAAVAPKPQVKLASKPQVDRVAKIAALLEAVETPPPAIENGITAKTAIEQVNNVMVVDESLPPPVEMQDNGVTPMIVCDNCNHSKNSCQCLFRGKNCSHLRNWWHNTDLYRHHAKNIGQPDLFCERPLGVCIDGFAGAMIAAGKADRAMLHHYDFVHHADGEIELTQRGRGELGRIAGIMNDFDVPLLIESTSNPGQDAARRNAVANAIAQLGLQIPNESIQITADRTIGLSGVDAEAVHVIRTTETATGASRTRPYQEASGATQIPLNSGTRAGAPR